MNKPKATKRVPLGGPEDPRHGTDNCYTYWRCHCDRCKAAHALVARLARGATPPARCPLCSAAATKPPIVKIDDGVNLAIYIDGAGHLWETRWADQPNV